MSLDLNGFKSGAGKLATPAKALGEAVLANAEKMACLQLESGKIYTEIAFRQLKQLPEIKSLERAGDFFWGQIGPLSEINKQLLNDWKSLTNINNDFTRDVKSAFASQAPQSHPPATSHPSTPEHPVPVATATGS